MYEVEQAKEFIREVFKDNKAYFSDDRGRGVLDRLGQTFPHRWTYVAELLQNAIDVHAKNIRFQIDSDKLAVEHDGNPFKQENVRSLCVAGVSTKGVDTIGFMGVGFKSVFHTYQEVCVSSGPWRFTLRVKRKASGSEIGEQITDWLGAVLPFWDESCGAPSEGMRCRFVLRNRLPDLGSVKDDLDRVVQSDLSLLPLLARRGVEKLDWGEHSWCLRIQDEPSVHEDVQIKRIFANDVKGVDQRSWLLLATQYEPPRAAIREFLEQRGKQPPRNNQERENFYQKARRTRQIEGFLELNADGCPQVPSKGKVFAVLPIDMQLPIGLNIQADWLLVVTRAEPINLDTSSAWHDEIRNRIPNLIFAFLGWLVKHELRPGWEHGYDVLPDFNQETPGAEWLLHEEFKQRLVEQLSSLPFLPTLRPGRFVTPQQGRFLPSEFADLQNNIWQPLALFGQNAVPSNRLSNRVIRALEMLGLYQEMSAADFRALLNSDGISRWQDQLPEKQRIAGLIRLLSTLSRLQRHDDSWRKPPFVCLPTEDDVWIDRVRARRLPADWHVLAQEPELQAGLKPFVGPDSCILSWNLWQTVTTRVGDRSEMGRREEAREYLEEIDAVSLEGAVARWWQNIPETPDAAQRHMVLRFTRWVFHKQPDRKALVAKLLCRDHLGRERLLSPEKTLLAQPYLPDYRRCFFPDVPSIVSEYLEENLLENTSISAWTAFFTELKQKPQGEFTFKLTCKPYPRWQKNEVARQVGLDEKNIGECRASSSKNYPGLKGYYVCSHTLPPAWPNESPLSLNIAQAASRWLAESRGILQKESRLAVGYIPSYSDEPKLLYGQIHAPWVSRLSNQRWIPVRHGDAVLKPADVLTAPDPARPDVPVADLEPELIAALQNAGIEFGSNIPKASTLHHLRANGPQATNEELLKLLQDAIEEAENDTTARKHLLNLLDETPLLPASTQEPNKRTVYSRIVWQAGVGGKRSSLGGWLTAVEDFPENSIARQILDIVDNFERFPDTTTARQALDYLEQIWRTRPEVEMIRRILPLAYEYVVQDLDGDIDLRKRWDAVKPNAQVFTMSPDRRWQQAGHCYFMDLGVGLSGLPGHLFENCPIASPAHLGSKPEAQKKTADSLGLGWLSNRFQIGYESHDRQKAPELMERLRKIRASIVKLRQNRDQETALPMEDDEPAIAHSVPMMNRVKDLWLTVHENGAEVDRRRVHAALQNETILVCGCDSEYAPELTQVLVEFWGLSRRGDLAAPLGVFVARLDDPDGFESQINAPDDGSGSEQPSRPVHLPRHANEAAGVEYDQSKVESKGEVGNASVDRLPAPQVEQRDGVAMPPVDRPGSGRYRPQTVDDKIRWHLARLRELMGAEAVPTEPADTEQEPMERLGDAVYRQAAMEYERRKQRFPIAMDFGQEGYDLESYSGPEGDPKRQLLRRIEVKGRSHPWRDDEIVTPSRRQFRDALNHDAAGKGWDYWLYVVTGRPDVGFQIQPLCNPARESLRFELRACRWAWRIEESGEIEPLDEHGDFLIPDDEDE